MISPFLILTAPISMISFLVGRIPVVSRSTQTYVLFIIEGIIRGLEQYLNG